MRTALIVFSISSLFCSSAFAAPPKELLGKSVSISWNETREQKWPGESQLRHVNRNGDLIIYVSSAGRVFNRLSYGGGGGRGKAKYKGSSDQVGGGGSDGFENRVVNFQGQSLSLHTPMSGGVRAINVSFSDGFTGCTASVLTGKEGSGKIVMKSLGSGKEFEIHSISTGGAHCSISEGNLFGGG